MASGDTDDELTLTIDFSEFEEETMGACPPCRGTGWHREEVIFPPKHNGSLKKTGIWDLTGCPLCQKPEDRGHADRGGTGRVTATVIAAWRRGNVAL